MVHQPIKKEGFLKINAEALALLQVIAGFFVMAHAVDNILAMMRPKPHHLTWAEFLFGHPVGKKYDIPGMSAHG